jgi:C-terminal processing protease CtpA/Prc
MKFLLLIFITLSTTTVFAQGKIVAVYRQAQPGKSPWCWGTAYETADVKDRAEYDVAIKAFKNKYEKVESTYFIKPDESAIVYEAVKNSFGYNCHYPVVIVMSGKSVQEIRERMQKDLLKNPKAYVVQPSEKIVWGEIISK